MSVYRRQWDTPEPDPVPSPEVTQRPAVADELSRSIRQLIAKVGADWTVKVTYARGPVIYGGGAKCGQWTGRIVDCVAVRMRHALGGAAVGCFHDGAFEEGWVWIVCSRTDCPQTGRDHPGTLPVQIGYRDLCRLVSDDEELTARMEDLR